MHFSSVTILALAAAATAEKLTFVKAPAPSLMGLLRRQDAEDVQKCGEGNSCAEACGAGHESCPSTDGLNYCYNPTAGETCCEYPGKGSSCEAGFFCAHDDKETTFCCAEGSPLDVCAGDYEDVSGPLTSDPPVEATPSAEPTTATADETTAESTAEPTETATGPAEGGNSTATMTGTGGSGPVPTDTPIEVPEGAAASLAPFTAAALLVVGAVAAML